MPLGATDVDLKVALRLWMYKCPHSPKWTAPVREHCKNSWPLLRQFEKALIHRGCLEADLQAAQILPIGILRLGEIAQATRQAEKELVTVRHAYVEHISECIVCSRHIVYAPETGK
jgi:hypothetical protein